EMCSFATVAMDAEHGPDTERERIREQREPEEPRPRRDRGSALVVGDTGFEPVTSSVSGKRATAAPIARAPEGARSGWSGRPDSNRRPSPWQGDALPAELRPHCVIEADAELPSFPGHRQRTPSPRVVPAATAGRCGRRRGRPATAPPPTITPRSRPGHASRPRRHALEARDHAAPLTGRASGMHLTR